MTEVNDIVAAVALLRMRFAVPGSIVSNAVVPTLVQPRARHLKARVFYLKFADLDQIWFMRRHHDPFLRSLTGMAQWNTATGRILTIYS